jgi:hypothetical protein
MGRMKGFTEGAQQSRYRMRRDAAILREDFLLALYARGLTYDQIADRMRKEFGGSPSKSTVATILPRALARRAKLREEDTERLAIARQKYLLHLETMLGALMPRAIGGRDEDGELIIPDVRAGALLLQVLDRIAEIEGAKTRPEHETHNTNININVGGDGRERAVAAALNALQAEADKQRTVEGHLAAVGTTAADLEARRDTGNQLPPPPLALPPGIRPAA